ncbi:MAG: bifunctional metallophosphatase/5'-nucleotidase, partial [Dermatophilaceae bacterium]
MNRLRGAVVAAVALTSLAIAPAVAAGKPPAPPTGKAPVIMSKSEVEVQILALNDFHGNLQPPSGSSGRVGTPPNAVDAGGAEYLATHVKALEATNRNTVVVSAGDLIGASPLLSALFHDEPTIEAMNQIG